MRPFHLSRRSRAVLLGLVASALTLASGCGGGEATTTSTPGGGGDNASPTASSEVAKRLASHLFLAVGDSRSIEGLGELLETIPLSDPPAVSVADGRLLAERRGIACLRFRYRATEAENSVQTLCVVAFDEVGSCEGQTPLRLDLEQFLPAEAPRGNANLLEYGSARFYAACRTAGGAYRLQQSGDAIPNLYFHVVDALGDGPYSLGSDELEAQRNGAVVTFSGDELRPPWILTLSREISELSLSQAAFTFNEEDCSEVPSCTSDPETIAPGDILRVGWGIGPGLLEQVVATAPVEVLDAYTQARIGISWEELGSVHPDLKMWVMWRLLNLDVMDTVIRSFDDQYELRARGITIAYSPFWAVREVSEACYPDPAEKALCRDFERAVGAEEAARIRALADAGFSLWFSAPIDYREGGQFVSFDRDLRPHYSLFEGILATVGANSSFEVPDIGTTMAGAVKAFASEIGADTPVVLAASGPPITANTGGHFCEADICEADFKGTYDQTEAWLTAAVAALAPGQLRGFGAALFEGSHFDIRDPHEEFGGFALNRAAETGYNNPVLNIWRAR